MVKWKGVIKISSKMRSKMERSNKNTRTKCNGISITHNTRARQLGEGWSKPGAGVETRGSKLVFYRGRNFSPELHRQHHTAGMPTGRGGRGAGTRTRERQGRGNARTRTGANLGCQESTSRLQGSAARGVACAVRETNNVLGEAKSLLGVLFTFRVYYD